jgi:hypothetical protein
MKAKHGKVVYEDSICMLAMMDDDFLKKHKLKEQLSPAKFVEAFLPVTKAVHNTKCSIERWCSYTNLKACCHLLRKRIIRIQTKTHSQLRNCSNI